MDLLGFDIFGDNATIKGGVASPFSDQPSHFGMDFHAHRLPFSDPVFHLLVPAPDSHTVVLNRYQSGSLNAGVSFHKPMDLGSPLGRAKQFVKKTVAMNESTMAHQDLTTTSSHNKSKRADMKSLASSLSTLSTNRAVGRGRSPRAGHTSAASPGAHSGRSAHRSQTPHGGDQRTPLSELLSNDFGAFNVNPELRTLFSGSGRIETPTVTRVSQEGESLLDAASGVDDSVYYLEKSIFTSAQANLFSGGALYFGPTNIDSLETARHIREERNGAEGRKFDPAVMRLLAQEYIHGGKEKGLLPKESCRHNMAVAQKAGFMCRASVFGTILTLLPDVDEKRADRVVDTDASKTAQQTTPHVTSQSKEVPSSSSEVLPFAVELLGEVLLDMLDIGDCQHFVIACEIILQTSKALLDRCLESAKIPSTRRLEAYYSYIELLRRFQQFSKVNEIIMQTDIANSEVLNQRGVLIHISCSICGKELPDRISTPWCQKCRRTVGLCVVCNEPVRGLMRWCAVCGHGGHVDCMRVWYSRCGACPSGCGHDCNALAQYGSSLDDDS